MRKPFTYIVLTMFCALFIAATPCNICEIMKNSKYSYCCSKEEIIAHVVGEDDPEIHPLFLLTSTFLQ